MPGQACYGSVQSLKKPQRGQTILQWDSYIRSPHRLQRWAHSVVGVGAMR